MCWNMKRSLSRSFTCHTFTKINTKYDKFTSNEFATFGIIFWFFCCWFLFLSSSWFAGLSFFRFNLPQKIRLIWESNRFNLKTYDSHTHTHVTIQREKDTTATKKCEYKNKVFRSFYSRNYDRNYSLCMLRELNNLQCCSLNAEWLEYFIEVCKM